MEIRQINALDYIEKAWKLLEAHREELATNKGIMVLAPDMQRYRQLDIYGLLFTLGLFDDAGEIVGYSVNILSKLLHYESVWVVQNDLLYLREDLRGTRWGMRLMYETEKLAKEKGAKVMHWHAKEKTTFAEMLSKLEYKVQDIIFSKEL